MLIIILLLLTLFGILINLIVSIRLFFQNNHQKVLADLAQTNADIKINLSRLESILKEEFSRNRDDFNTNAKNAREEQIRLIKLFEDSLLTRMASLIKSNEEKLEQMRQTIEVKLNHIQADSSQKLELMRQTVDEKLHKTLELRLGESFKLVSERLELVHKGLGEMQNLATGVGDLKKVLSNVKTRGVLGEIQLENILDQILAPEQYAKNIVTKKSSSNFVEFAIKLPGKDENGDPVYLPIDSKFPLEPYYALLEAYDQANPQLIIETEKFLENTIKKCAKDIHEKYIDPPNTTDFGIMFLPIEGLYAQVVKSGTFMEILQRDYKIIVTGPTTLCAFLNSLQMGFKTLVIEKRSSEVWSILAAVKTEFEKFGTVLKKTQEKLTQANNELDDLIGTRTRQIQKRLKTIQDLPSAVDTQLILESPIE